MRRRHSPLLAILVSAAATAADRLPLGTVATVDGDAVAVRFDDPAAPGLIPGGLVALYGQGSVVKHPLTGEVLIEDRRLVARAQITAVGPTVLARLVWRQDGVAVAPGLDAVPLPGEAAPNAAPVPATPVNRTVPAGAVVAVALPATDPDGDPLLYTWSLASPLGGRLGATTTGAGEVAVQVPAVAGIAVTITATARDPLGQTGVATATLTTMAAADPASRTLTAAARWGDAVLPQALSLARDAAGRWWLLGERGAVAVTDGFAQATPLVIGKENAPDKPVALACHGGVVHLLDAGRRQVALVRPDGRLVRTVGGCAAPTDLDVAADGTIYVADQGLGGILVIEADGKIRGLLGRPGTGDDAVTGLIRVAVRRTGEIAGLDALQRQIVRFDRFGRRLPTLRVPGPAEDAPVDLASVPAGLAVLMASGRITVLDGDGRMVAGTPGLADLGLVARVSPAVALGADQDGTVLVAYAAGHLVRHGAGMTGVRGPGLCGAEVWCTDGRGRAFALDEDGRVTVFDHEGWAVARLPGGAVARGVAMAAVPDGSAVLVLDGKKQAVHRYAVDDLAAATKAGPLSFGGPGTYNGQFEEAVAIASDEAGRAYVLDADQHRVSVFDAKGQFITSVGAYGKGAADLREPVLVAVAPAGDALYVFDAAKNEVKKFGLDLAAGTGTHRTNAGGKGDAGGQFRTPLAMGVDRQGLLWVVDGGRSDIQAVDFRGASANALLAVPLAKLGAADAAAACLHPDGGALVVADGVATTVR
jgi:DNA-binding beta-propeller fold protein YncE